MKRIDKIYNYILNNSKKFTKDKLLEIKGFNAQEIEESLDILKSNVCRELNILCREKKIIKIKNRPVRYVERECFENILCIKLPDNLEEILDINDYINNEKTVNVEDESPFNYLIGANTACSTFCCYNIIGRGQVGKRSAVLKCTAINAVSKTGTACCTGSN